MSLSAILQNGPGAAATEEARPRPGADVELSTDIELIDSVLSHRTVGVDQTPATLARVAKLLSSAVSVSSRSFC